MKRLIQSDITKILLFLILTTVCAAILSPWLYNIGKMITEMAETRHVHPAVRWLAHGCRDAGFPRFFNIAMLVSSLILAGPLIMWLELGKGEITPHRSPWRFRLPAHSIVQEHGQPLTPNPRTGLHLITGFLLTTSLSILMGWLLLITGWLTLLHPVAWMSATLISLASAVATALIEQWIIMGIILGIFLRAMKPISAIVATSFFFAFIHWLLDQSSIQVPRPEELDAGFQLLSLTAQRVMQPSVFALSFINLWVLGLILAYTRHRTASLWFPIGLYTGWLFIHGLFLSITKISGAHLSHAEVFIGEHQKSGVLPLCFLIATGLLSHVFVQFSSERHEATADDEQPL